MRAGMEKKLKAYYQGHVMLMLTFAHSKIQTVASKSCSSLYSLSTTADRAVSCENRVRYHQQHSKIPSASDSTLNR
jgi:hypothetical protein